MVISKYIWLKTDTKQIQFWIRLKDWIDIEESTGTSYERKSLSLPFYTYCIIIVRCQLDNEYSRTYQ